MQFKPQALRLLYFGFYDEALGLIRSIGEIANLLFLFNLDQTVYADWKALPEDRRRQKFGPVKVRIALENIATAKSVELRLLSVGEDRYRTLSARSAHVTPETKPQDYNLRGRPVLGGLFRGQPGPRQPRPQKNLEQNSAQDFAAPKRPFTAEEFRSVTRSHFFMGAVSFWREIERRVQLDEAIRIHRVARYA